MITNKTPLIIFFLIILFSAVAYSADAPMLPSFFYGKAKVNGRDVPVNSNVIAKIDNEKRGEIVVDISGLYGSKNTDQKLSVAGNKIDIRKDVEFYLKLSGKQEIKATQKSIWQSGAVTELNLTFNGQEIAEVLQNEENDTTQQPSDDATDTNRRVESDKNKESFPYALIQAGRQIRFSINNFNIPVTRLQLVLKNNVTDVVFDIEAVASPNAPAVADVYKYFSINAPKIQDDNVETAIIRFKVSNDWLANYDVQKVVLLRYNNNKWNELQTIDEGADQSTHQYRASTPGFSYFAIKSAKNESKSINSREATTHFREEGKEELTGEIGDEPASNKGLTIRGLKPNIFVGITIIVVLVAAGLLVYYYSVKKVGGKKK